MSRILPGERAPRKKNPNHGRPIIAWPPPIYASSIVRLESSIYIRDNPAFPNVLCLSGFSPKTMRKINRQLKHARQLSHKEHMVIAWNHDYSFKTITNEYQLMLHSFTGISTYTRDWIHLDLPGVAIVETIRQAPRSPATRGPTILFFPGKLDMINIITRIAPAWVSTIRAVIKLLLPMELGNIILDFIPSDGFDEWFASAS